jgi:hypothetical protein
VGPRAVEGGYERRLAAVIGPAVFMLGAAGGHIYQIATHGNYASGNSGLLLWMDIIIPLAGFLFLALRGQRDSRTLVVSVRMNRTRTGPPSPVPTDKAPAGDTAAGTSSSTRHVRCRSGQVKARNNRKWPISNIAVRSCGRPIGEVARTGCTSMRARTCHTAGPAMVTILAGNHVLATQLRRYSPKRTLPTGA